MLSLESMEQRLDNPKAYYVFYEFFYKAPVGETRWKECMDSDNERIGNNTTEAFALLLVANNYKAWLYEEKMNHGSNLLTEYETLPGIGTMSIVDKLLVDQEVVLETGLDEIVVRDAVSLGFKKATKKRKDWLAKLKRQAICNKMKRSWQTSTANGILEGPLCQLPTNKKEREKKKRKLMKGLKKWTGIADEGERKFKGWSDSGHKAYEEWTTAIKVDVGAGKYALWEKAFSLIHQEAQGRIQDETQRVEKYAVNKSLVWEL
jgi:hypothetical protein